MTRDDGGRTIDDARIAAILLVACAAFWALRVWWSTGSPVSFGNAEAQVLFLLQVREAAAQWRSGSLPLWNSYQAIGTPLLATQQVAALYPLNLLYVFLDLGPAWLLTSLLHHMIGVLGAFAFCRALGLRPRSALLGAAAYAFSPAMLEKYGVPDEFICFAWLPVLFACAQWLTRRPSLRLTCCLAGASALQILGGDADTIARSAMLLGSFVTLRVLQLLRVDVRRAILVALAGMGSTMFAMALTAAQWLPTWELVRHSVRALGALSREQQAVLAADASLLLGNLPRAVPLILVLLGLWRLRHRPEGWFLGMTIVLFGTIALGPVTPLFDLARSLPAGEWFRAPARFLGFWPLCFAPLVAAGAEVVLRRASSSERRCWPTIAVAIFLTLAARAVFSLAGAPRESLPRKIGMDAVLLGVFGAAVALARGTRGVRAGRVTSAAAFLIIFCIPLALYAPGYLSPHRIDETYRPYAEIFAELRHQQPARTLSILPTPGEGARIWPFWAKFGTYFQTPVFNDNDPLSTRDFYELVQAIRGPLAAVDLESALATFVGELSPPRPQFDARLLNLSGVRFVVAPADPEGLPPRGFGPGMPLRVWQRWAAAVVYENPAALPAGVLRRRRGRARRGQPLPRYVAQPGLRSRDRDPPRRRGVDAYPHATKSRR